MAAPLKVVLAGAIRWDAWYSNVSPCYYAQRALGPSAWESRAPWFSTAHPTDNLIDCNGDRQLVIDLEIGYAAASGLKFWAFDQYDPSGSSGPVMKAWSLYQTSALNSQINWCWIALSDSLFGSAGNYSAKIAQYVSWFQQSNYQKILSNRPLLFLFFTTFPAFGGASSFATMLSALRAATTTAGLGSPYVVIMGGLPDSYNAMQAIGADAISSYMGSVPAGQPTAYAAMDQATQNFWASMAQTGAPIIPVAQMGWDTRPRQQNPPPWTNPSPNWVFPGTIAERCSHLQAAVDYVTAHPAACPSQATIVYSWTECDEGGGALIPTLGDPPAGLPPKLNQMLSAVAGILR